LLVSAKGAASARGRQVFERALRINKMLGATFTSATDGQHLTS
jgi:hypothetical protein